MLKQIYSCYKIFKIWRKYNLIELFSLFPVCNNKLTRISRTKKNSLLSLAERLNLAFQEMGPIFIKFGQSLSTRPDLIGYELANSLKSLQDKLAPFSSQKAIEILQKELKSDIYEVFEEFETEPISAASISQVHKGKLKTGEIVAIKILRPSIEKKYAKDISLLFFCAKLINISKKFRRLRPIDVIKVFEKQMYSELDLKIEAANLDEMHDNFKINSKICLPRIYWNLTTKSVLVTEFIEGFSVYEIDLLKSQNINLSLLARNLVILFFEQVYDYGFFHADLHPGNILIKPSGKICLIDFGITGRIGEKDRFAIAESLYGFLSKNYKLIAKAHMRAGYVPKNCDLDLFTQYCRSISGPMNNFKKQDISIGGLLGELFQITENFSMQVQPQLLLLQKTIVVVEGVALMLDPNLNIWHIIEPMMKKWAKKNISAEAKILRTVKICINKMFDKLNEDSNLEY